MTLSAAPVVEWPDPAPAVAAYLREQLGVQTGGRAPSASAIDRGSEYLQVADDGTTDLIYPVRAITAVRLTAWAADRDAAHALASSARSHVLAMRGHPVIRSADFVSGPIEAVDPDLGDALASVVVNVVTRPVGA